MIKTLKDFKNIIELLEWRKQALQDIMDRLAPSNHTSKEYYIRIKELDWLIGKLNQRLEIEDEN